MLHSHLCPEDASFTPVSPALALSRNYNEPDGLPILDCSIRLHVVQVANLCAARELGLAARKIRTDQTLKFFSE